MREYTFQEQLKVGDVGESLLDRLFAENYQIEVMDIPSQRNSLPDRVFHHKSENIQYRIEYKTDDVASRTGNVFIETISNDAIGKLGWVYNKFACRIAYYLSGLNKVFLLKPELLRSHIPEWSRKYKIKTANNKSYNGHGICVPLHELQQCCIAILDFPPHFVIKIED